MRLKDVTERFGNSKFYRGKYKKFECRINYSSNLDCWYYCIDSKDEKRYKIQQLME